MQVVRMERNVRTAAERVIPFSEDELIALERLATKHRLGVGALIHGIVGAWLALQRPSRAGTARLPFPGEVLRAQRKVIAAMRDLDAARKLAQDPPPVPTPKRAM